MVSLDDLAKVEGVAAVGRFAVDGRCADYKANMDMSKQMADKTAQYLATVTMMFNTLADAFSKETGMSWTPQEGWTYSGGNWTVVVWGDVGVFCDTENTDMGELFEVLEGSEMEAPSI
jgi:roadblock/LC7 domain-containing protein